MKNFKKIGLPTVLILALILLVDPGWNPLLGVDLVGFFASLIIGFGAQSLTEDAITGVFIIFEGQYHVGDRHSIEIPFNQPVVTRKQ